jgi:SAM-dependent methyltransferase
VGEKPPPVIYSPSRRVAARGRAAKTLSAHDFLHRRAMEDVVDRLETTTRGFPRSLFYGAGALVSLLTEKCGVGEIVHGDLASDRLERLGPALAFDEERSPLAPQSFDLIVSLLTLHAVNDLVGALAQARSALKPDGLFLAALFGEGTLASLRAALYRAEADVTGGVSARISPFASVRDLGGALRRAGFALPVADFDSIKVSYSDPSRLIADLRGMGETSVLASSPRPLKRSVLAAALADLAAAGGDVKFNLVFLTGWAPHPSQQQPLRPGSANASLAEVIRGAVDKPGA